MTNGRHVTFTNNVLSAARRSLIDIESNSKSDEISYLTVRNNQFGSYRLCTFTNYGRGPCNTTSSLPTTA